MKSADDSPEIPFYPSLPERPERDWRYLPEMLLILATLWLPGFLRSLFLFVSPDSWDVYPLGLRAAGAAMPFLAFGSYLWWRRVRIGGAEIVVFAAALLAEIFLWWPASEGADGYVRGYPESVAMVLGLTPSLAVAAYLLFNRGFLQPEFGFCRIRAMDAVDGVLLMVALLAVTMFSGRILTESSYPWQTGYIWAIYLPGFFSWAILTVALILNSLAEEICWRGWLIPMLERARPGFWLPVGLSSLLFASYHVHYGLNGFLTIFVDGLVLGAYFYTVRRILPVILAHTLLNLVYSAMNQ
jgi:membrane protease YdiL (CAAX protease family)